VTSYIISVATLASIFAFATLSLNLQYGMTGLVNFGQITFVIVGAYSVAISVTHGYSWWLGALIAPIAGGTVGLLLAFVGRRLRQDYWALMTLAVAALLTVILETTPSLAGGTDGIYGIPSPFGTWTFIALLVGLIALSLAMLERIRRSQYGRVIRAMREDELLVKSLGMDIARYEFGVMLIGGALASLSGVAYAIYITYVSPGAFSLTETFVIWIALVIGGTGSNYGSIAGIVMLQAILAGILFLPGSGQTQAILGVVIEGLLLISIMLFRPQGLIPEPRRQFIGNPQAQTLTRRLLRSFRADDRIKTSG
jgi:branched-chain amino acid transport system permease protein